MIIAIDGPAGVGKSTIAKMIASELGFYFLNSGNFYRALAYGMLRSKIDINNGKERLEFASRAEFSVSESCFCINGEDVKDKIHNPEIDSASSSVSFDPLVREEVNRHLRDVASKMNVVCEGRDITTVVFPDAEFKFYFDARPEVRAKRRFSQGESSKSYSEVLEEIIKRDEADRNKPVGALKIASDALYIDTSDLTISEVCEKVSKAVKAQIN